MNPVDEFARIRAEIQTLEAREKVLRASFLRPEARLRSNGFEVTVKNQIRRVFQKDRLAAAVLNDPSYWLQSISQIVTVKALGAATDKAKPPIAVDDFDLIEPF